MPETTLVSVADAVAAHGRPDWVFVDCRFSLQDTEEGRRKFREQTIAAAKYAHLDEDLSGPVVRGRTGRHPLPDPEKLVRSLRRLGISNSSQVVAFDASGGSFAARLWWLLREFFAHQAVAVLDGGFPAWVQAGGPVAPGRDGGAEGDFSGAVRRERWLDTAEVAAGIGSGKFELWDARDPKRYRGEVEPIDPVAGHVPGAKNVPLTENLDASGRFLPKEVLRKRFEEILEGKPASQVVAYCGSGVTACHDLLALEHAGLHGARLYAGSWSEWIADPGRPVAKG